MKKLLLVVLVVAAAIAAMFLMLFTVARFPDAWDRIMYGLLAICSANLVYIFWLRYRMGRDETAWVRSLATPGYPDPRSCLRQYATAAIGDSKVREAVLAGIDSLDVETAARLRQRFVLILLDRTGLNGKFRPKKTEDMAGYLDVDSYILGIPASAGERRA